MRAELHKIVQLGRGNETVFTCISSIENTHLAPSRIFQTNNALKLRFLEKIIQRESNVYK